ncbi:PTS glucitol/sorbitol transporter subunit IIA [Caenibacillus caldisaponilyticus]|uniref:PTS glucitol/sorbitol transporter subunit IIA n=1 Tax=Caenibacillus caldisaponilyticus TaxID=1674942 RepID=UPI00098836BD|nr:PTS glucitol/sorbitol transporter subunit IIA [Caenibacillus caldisaponilyticus]
MEDIYETQIVNIGCYVDELQKEKMIVLFGENAPKELKDYCYLIRVNSVNGGIVPGATLYLDSEQFEITAVGDAVVRNLRQLGHITIRFDGSRTAELPGTLYVEEKPIPSIEIGTKLKISK